MLTIGLHKADVLAPTLPLAITITITITIDLTPNSPVQVLVMHQAAVLPQPGPQSPPQVLATHQAPSS